MKNVQISPFASRLARKCRSSKHTSEPNSASGSTAPQTVTASTPSAPSAFSAAMFARCVTWFESRGCPAPWREMCSTSTPAHVPCETNASPQSVETGSGPTPSNPGSAYVPEPVRIPIVMAAGRYRARAVDARITSSGGDGAYSGAGAPPISASSARVTASPNSA